MKKFPLVLITVISQMTSPDLIKWVVPVFNVSSHWSLVAFSCLPHSISSTILSQSVSLIQSPAHFTWSTGSLRRAWGTLGRAFKVLHVRWVCWALLASVHSLLAVETDCSFFGLPSSYFFLVSHCLQSMAEVISVKWESNDHAWGGNFSSVSDCLEFILTFDKHHLKPR